MSLQKKAYAVLACLICITLFGCSHTYRENQLVGFWRLKSSATDARLTYYSNHTWALIVISPDNPVASGTAFGSWRLNSRKIITTTESSLGNKAADISEVGEVIKLTASTLVLRNREADSKETTSIFYRVDAPTKALSDDEYTQKLFGTWLYSYTNRIKIAGVQLYTRYEPNGIALWHGTVFRNNRSSAAPSASGTWRVEHGYLVTSITNAQSESLTKNKETRDQILQITDSQFSFRDENGAIKKDLRVQ